MNGAGLNRLGGGLRLRSPTGAVASVRDLRRAGTRLEPLLHTFYAFFPFWLATHLELLSPLWSPPALELQWPVAWVAWVGPELGARSILVGAGLVFLFAPLLPRRRAVRIAVFLALLEVLALQYSFGKIHHSMHGWLYASFFFAVFLPDEAFDLGRRGRRSLGPSLRTFHAAQVMTCLTYTLAGVGKLLGTAYQATLGQITPLHPSALARHIADRLLQTFPETTLGPWMIEHGVWLWPAMLGTLYIQTAALWVAFRPTLHRLWGAALIGFHVVTALSMTIDFSPQILLVGLLLVGSPFAPSSPSLPRMVRDLPLLPRGRRRRGGADP